MTTPTISPWPLVRQGDQAHPVQTLQYLLRAHGRTLAVDGVSGPALTPPSVPSSSRRAWPSTASSARPPGWR